MGGGIRVVMVPWSAFGHLMPYFQLSIALAKAGVHVSFLSTPSIIGRLPKVPSSLSPLLKMVGFPLPSPATDKLGRPCPPLPSGAEATVDIPFDMNVYLKLAIDALEQPIGQYISQLSPDWIISDFFYHWLVPLSHRLNIRLIFFSVFSGATNACIGPPDQLCRKVPESSWIEFESSVVIRNDQRERFAAESGTEERVVGIASEMRAARVQGSCQAMIIRTCRELEGKYLNTIEKNLGKPVIPLGLLPPAEKAKEATSMDDDWRKIFLWLDEQSEGSVVFVSFGSECKLSNGQVEQIGRGLEESQLPFLWALRKPSWTVEELDGLPIGFEERVGNRGVVKVGWAPQLDILAHPSIGGSLFHAGWGSIIETLQFGNTLIMLPFIVDQPMNARLMVEKGLGIEVERGEDGSFSGKDVANALRVAMGSTSEKAKQLKAKAKEAQALIGDRKLHENYLLDFVEYLKNGRQVGAADC